jgi:nitrate reductase delta subunit
MTRLFSTPPKRAAYTLRALAWLLRYPGEELRTHLPDLQQALHDEASIGPERLAEIDALIRRLQSLPAMRAEAEYVEIFDRGRGTALHLFEHVHGDSRDRGPAMIDLAQTYAAAGLDLGSGELPDFLPVVLEYASTQPPAQARAFVAEFAHILQAIFSALRRRESPYASVVAALLELAGERAQAVPLPDEPELDAEWAEPAAFDGCARQGQQRPGQPQPIHVSRKTSDTRGARA